MNFNSTTSHGSRHKRGTAVAGRLRSIIVRLSIMLIVNLPACWCTTYQQTEQLQQIEYSIIVESMSFHLELKVQR